MGWGERGPELVDMAIREYDKIWSNWRAIEMTWNGSRALENDHPEKRLISLKAWNNDWSDWRSGEPTDQ